MLPTFDLGPWQLYTHNVAYALGVLVAWSLAIRRLLTLDAPSQVIARAVALVLSFGLAGAYLINVVPATLQYLKTGSLDWTWSVSWVGVLIFGIGIGLLYVWKSDLPLGRTFDLVAVPLPLVLVIGRLGCLGAGCCYGLETDSWLGVYLPDVQGEWAVRYPTQVLSGVASLFTFFILLALERYGLRRADTAREADPLKPPGSRIWPFDGFLFLLYVAFFCVERGIMESLRGDAVPVLGPCSWVHLVTLAGLVGALALIAWNLERSNWS